jgi:hypothetical protein
MNPKRRLPLVQTPGPGQDADEPPRPPWHWVGFGTVAIFVAWLPLSAIAGFVGKRLLEGAGGAAGLDRAVFATLASYAVALGLGAVAGGYVVGRWGGEAVGVREAALSGLGVTILVTLVSWASFGLAPGTLLVAVLAVPMAALGGWLGRRRVRAGSRRP